MTTKIASQGASRPPLQSGSSWLDRIPGWVTPNGLTVARMVLTAAILVLDLTGGGLGWIILLGLMAGFSDLLDGALARRRGQVTALGAWLDPMGDKFFALVLVFMIWRRQVVPGWLLLTLLITEAHVVLVPLLEAWSRRRTGRALRPLPKVQPNRFGKLKTGWLASAMGLMFIGLWAGWPWLLDFARWNLAVVLGLGLVAQYYYLVAWRRGDFS